MTRLYIDFETRSELDVGVVGTHKYATHPSTSVVLVSWAIDGGEVHVDEEVSDELWRMIENDNVLKIAHNAEFDMAICKYVLGINISYWSWFDTAYQAAYIGLPRKLAHLAAMLHTTQKASQEEMLLFATPARMRREARADELFGGGAPTVWRTKDTHPEEWKRFLDYSRDDIIVMRECHAIMPALPDFEVWTMRFTFEMNFNGVPFDVEFASKIKAMADKYAKDASDEAKLRFGIENLRSTQQVQDALRNEGLVFASLNKKEREGKTHSILELRDKATGAAFSKIPTAIERICPDQRLHGEFVGYGAHTGRWSSRGVQLQNFARILSSVSTDLTRVRDYDHLRQHLRLCIHANKGYKFVCADLSQIEARVVAWLAGCDWRLRAFANDEDIYSRSAERMFGLPKVDKSMPERQMGKCAELGLGYGGGANAINRIAPDFYREQGAGKVDEIVRRWRAANPEICQLWRVLERGFLTALRQSVCKVTTGYTSISFVYDGKTMIIRLPSGRALYYRNVYNTTEGLQYKDYSRGGQFGTLTKIWGGVLAENITQAIARDVLVDIMKRIRLAHEDYFCIGTVHDEVWYLTKDDTALDVLLDAMSAPIRWADKLVTKGDGFISKRYIK